MGGQTRLAQEPKTLGTGATCLRVVIYLVGIAILLWMVSLLVEEMGMPFTSTPTPEPTMTPERSAWYACVLAVQEKFGLPIEQAGRYHVNHVEDLGQDTYRVEIRYIWRERDYQCLVAHSPSGDSKVLIAGPKP